MSRPRRFDRNLIVIGGGAAGLVAAQTAAWLGAAVSLFERDRMGGECLNSGCVPSKAFLSAIGRGAGFAEAIASARRAIAAIAPRDGAERYRALGVDVRLTEARFLDPWTLAAGGERLTARAFVIATGAAPLWPELPGLDRAPVSTTETIWDLKHLPRRLAVLGGGAAGMELAQGFARLGAAVSIIERAPRILPAWDEEAAALVAAASGELGIRIHAGAEALALREAGAGWEIVLRQGSTPLALPFDHLLLALGKRPRLDGLEALDLARTPSGHLRTDRRLRTSLPHIFAAGDVTAEGGTTHVAGQLGAYAALNALLGPLGRLAPPRHARPRALFTTPPLAAVGLDEAGARREGVDHEVIRLDLSELDRAAIEDERGGFVKLILRRRDGRLIGAVVAGGAAPEMIGEMGLAVQQRLPARALASLLHPYPGWGEAFSRAAGLWQIARLSPRLLSWGARFFRWQRG